MSTRFTDESIKCIKCSTVSSDLLCSFDHISLIGNCYHIYCKSCFKKENENCDFKSKQAKCPCCNKEFYEYVESYDEAVLIGEAAYFINDAKLLSPKLKRDKTVIHSIYNKALEKLEQALKLNPSNILTMFCIVQSCLNGLEYCKDIDKSTIPAHSFIDSKLKVITTNSEERYYCRQKIYELCLDLVDQGFDVHINSRVHILFDTMGQPKVTKLEECYNAITAMFLESNNIPAAYKYAKLAYETCLRSPLKSNLVNYKKDYLHAKKRLSEEPPLRFAVGDKVQFLYEVEVDVTEWRLGKIVEVYYRESSFPLVFTAPYRLQLLEDSGEVTDPPVYAYAKADLDRYVRKPGVRAVEDTRYQARLDA